MVQIPLGPPLEKGDDERIGPFSHILDMEDERSVFFPTSRIRRMKGIGLFSKSQGRMELPSFSHIPTEMVVEIGKGFNAFAIMGSLKAHFPGEIKKRFISFYSPPFLKEGQGGFIVFDPFMPWFKSPSVPL